MVPLKTFNQEDIKKGFKANVYLNGVLQKNVTAMIASYYPNNPVMGKILKCKIIDGKIKYEQLEGEVYWEPIKKEFNKMSVNQINKIRKEIKYCFGNYSDGDCVLCNDLLRINFGIDCYNALQYINSISSTPEYDKIKHYQSNAKPQKQNNELVRIRKIDLDLV